MAKIKTYRISKTVTSYSVRKGSYQKSISVQKDIPTLEEAIAISKEKYGNKQGLKQWRVESSFYPQYYKII